MAFLETQFDNLARGPKARERLDIIYTRVRDRICTNLYPPGSILNEKELASEFGVSRTPIRAVLQRLNHEGLVDTRNGVGTLVTDVDVFTFDALYQMRMKLAECIGDLSYLNGPDEHISRFEELRLRAQELGLSPDYYAIGAINLAVFRALQEIITSDPLREVTSLLYFRTARIWHKMIPNLNWDQERNLVNSEIEEILRALRMGDLKAVGLIRRNFISMACIRLRGHLATAG